jgi:hypothetical protein
VFLFVNARRMIFVGLLGKNDPLPKDLSLAEFKYFSNSVKTILRTCFLFFLLSSLFSLLLLPIIMPNNTYIGAIDQGTTTTRFLVFNDKGRLITSHQLDYEQIYPKPG